MRAPYSLIVSGVGTALLAVAALWADEGQPKARAVVPFVAGNGFGRGMGFGPFFSAAMHSKEIQALQGSHGASPQSSVFSGQFSVFRWELASRADSRQGFIAFPMGEISQIAEWIWHEGMDGHGAADHWHIQYGLGQVADWLIGLDIAKGSARPDQVGGSYHGGHRGFGQAALACYKRGQAVLARYKRLWIMDYRRPYFAPGGMNFNFNDSHVYWPVGMPSSWDSVDAKLAQSHLVEPNFALR
jgi:hypothetical protein